MHHLKELILSRGKTPKGATTFFARMPDDSIVSSKNNNDIGSNGHMSAMRFADKSLMVFVPGGKRTFSVDLTKLAGSKATAYWFNPATGTSTSAGTFASATKSQSFTTPSGTDWVLVVDDEAVCWPAP